MAVTLRDGRVLVAGGFVATDGPDIYAFSRDTTRIAEFYKPPPRRPVLTSPSVSRRGGSLSVAFSLNEAATVRMALTRRVAGVWRTVRVAPPRRARFGGNRFGLRAALRLRGLPAGRYRLVLRTRDPFGRTGHVAVKSLRL